MSWFFADKQINHVRHEHLSVIGRVQTDKAASLLVMRLNVIILIYESITFTFIARLADQLLRPA